MYRRIALVTLLAVAFAMPTASAQKKGRGGGGGKGKLTAAATGTLSLDQLNPVLGDIVTFSWSATDLPSNISVDQIRISLEGYIDGRISWGQSDFANDQTLLLVPWDMTIEGWPLIAQDVTCVAKLYYWTWEKIDGVDQQVFNELASLVFVAPPAS